MKHRVQDDVTGTPGTPLPLDALAFGAAAAAVSAIAMLALGILGGLGLYIGAVEMMQRWHLLFSPTPVGTIAGMAEAALVSFVVAWLLGSLYNAFAQR